MTPSLLIGLLLTFLVVIGAASGFINFQARSCSMAFRMKLDPAPVSNIKEYHLSCLCVSPNFSYSSNHE